LLVCLTLASRHYRQYLIEGKTRYVSRSAYIKDKGSATGARLVQAGLPGGAGYNSFFDVLKYSQTLSFRATNGSGGLLWSF
jgi:hypothetical protein